MSETPTIILRGAKEFTLERDDGSKKTYTLHKFDCVKGREILTKYPISMLPKVGDYRTSEATMLEMMAYVGVDINGRMQLLTHKALVINHVEDTADLLRIEWAMMEHNFGFFTGGRLQGFLGGVAQKYLQKIIAMLTDSSATSSETDSPPSTNSAPSTP